MYKITSGGRTIQVCDRPNYIKYLGSEQSPCTEKGYEGWVGYIEIDESSELKPNAILAEGQIYSITDLLDDLPKAEITEIDANLTALDAIAGIPGIKSLILDIETALCDIDGN